MRSRGQDKGKLGVNVPPPRLQQARPHQQIDEVRSGGGYFSQNDLRVHFGLGKAGRVDLLEIRWPSGQVNMLKDVKPNQVIYVKEGEGIVRSMQFPPKK